MYLCWCKCIQETTILCYKLIEITINQHWLELYEKKTLIHKQQNICETKMTKSKKNKKKKQQQLKLTGIWFYDFVCLRILWFNFLFHITKQLVQVIFQFILQKNKTIEWTNNNFILLLLLIYLVVVCKLWIQFCKLTRTKRNLLSKIELSASKKLLIIIAWIY